MKLELKLNLGAGTDHKLGWVNADIDPTTNPDVVLDLSSKLPFKSASVDKILLQDVLEHLSREEGQKLLLECFRILRKNAILKLRVPNVKQIVKQFGKDEAVMLEFIYGNTKTSGRYGSHRYGYTRQTLSQTLKRAGFKQINIITHTTNFIAHARKKTTIPVRPYLLIIQDAPDWGGAEEWTANLVREWAHKVKVVGYTQLPRLRQKWRVAGAQASHLPFRLDVFGNLRGLIKTTILFPYALVWYSRLLHRSKKQGVSLVLLPGLTEKLVVTWLARIYHLPVVWFEYPPLKPLFARNFILPKLFYRLTKHLPQRVFTISEHTKRSLLTDAHISAAKISLVYPGVSIPRTTAQVTQPIVGHLSRLAPEKGQRLLLNAWKYVVEAVPQAKLKIAGQGPDEAYLKNLCQNLGLSKSVQFLHFISEKKRFYKSLKLFVFPTIWELEGFGIVAAEALSFGLPIVAFHHGPVPEIVTAKVGILVREKKPAALAKAIIKLLKDNQAYQRRKESARVVAKSKFNLKVQSNLILKELTDVLKTS